MTFDWADDASPNTYEFQIGSDPTFAQANAAECTGVEWCVHTIPESRWTAPTLTTGTKYWRVRSGHGDISPTEPALVTITATLPTGSRSVQLTVDPPSIQLLTIGALTVSAGDLVGSVTLAGAAPSAGATVTFTSSNPALVPVPSPISIPAGGYTSPLTLRVNPGVRGDYCHDYRNNEFHLLPHYPPPSSHRRLSSRPATARRLPPASPCGSTGRTS